MKQPVQRSLQDIGGGHFINQFRAAGSADIGFQQASGDSSRRQAFIPISDGEIGFLHEVARKCPCRLCPRPFAAVHVDGKTNDQAAYAMFLAQVQQDVGINLKFFAFDDSQW